MNPDGSLSSNERKRTSTHSGSLHGTEPARTRSSSLRAENARQRKAALEEEEKRRIAKAKKQKQATDTTKFKKSVADAPNLLTNLDEHLKETEQSAPSAAVEAEAAEPAPEQAMSSVNDPNSVATSADTPHQQPAPTSLPTSAALDETTADAAATAPAETPQQPKDSKETLGIKKAIKNFLIIYNILLSLASFKIFRSNRWKNIKIEDVDSLSEPEAKKTGENIKKHIHNKPNSRSKATADLLREWNTYNCETRNMDQIKSIGYLTNAIIAAAYQQEASCFSPIKVEQPTALTTHWQKFFTQSKEYALTGPTVEEVKQKLKALR